jgi:hypothetical protein
MKSGEGEAEPSPKEKEALRVEEWRYVKGLQEEVKVVEVEVFVNENQQGEAGQKSKIRGKGFWRKVKRYIRYVFPKCVSEYSTNFIAGVDESQTDRWTRQISVINRGSNCIPTSGTMILRYHGQRMGNTTLFDDASIVATDRLRRRRDPRNTMPLFENLRAEMRTSQGIGTMPWNAAHGIERVLRHSGVAGSARWQWNYMSPPVVGEKTAAIGFVNAINLFDNFRQEVNRNQPPILFVVGAGGWGSASFGHGMPVLGTRKESFTWTCFNVNRHWLYVHTTWRGGANDLGNKRWYRFDKHVYPLAYWDAVNITM